MKKKRIKEQKSDSVRRGNVTEEKRRDCVVVSDFGSQELNVMKNAGFYATFEKHTRLVLDESVACYCSSYKLRVCTVEKVRVTCLQDTIGIDLGIVLLELLKTDSISDNV